MNKKLSRLPCIHNIKTNKSGEVLLTPFYYPVCMAGEQDILLRPELLILLHVLNKYQQKQH